MSNLRQKWRTFQGLDAVRRSCIVEALTLPPLIWLGFRLAGVPRTQHLLRRWTSSRPSAADSAGVIAAACWAQILAGRKWGVGGSCLVRSLTLWTMLRRRGVEPELRVGFRKSGGTVEGHAWVEYNGALLNENERVAGSYVTSEQPMSYDITPR